MITTLLESLQRKADWKIGFINKLPHGSDLFVPGEEVLYLVLGGEGQKSLLVTKMPRVERATDLNKLNKEMIWKGVTMPPSYVTAHSKE